MEREILFRGKKSKDGMWVEGFLKKDVKGHFRIQFDPACFTVVVNPETVGQLWIRIGNLALFDGDIFDFPKHNVRFVIQYNEKRSQFCIAHPNEIGLKYINPWQCPDEKWIDEFMNDAVLVGNIHDNPDLLK